MLKQLVMIAALCLTMAFPAFAQGFHMQLGPLHGGIGVGPGWDGGGWGPHVGPNHWNRWNHNWNRPDWDRPQWPHDRGTCWVWVAGQWVWRC